MNARRSTVGHARARVVVRELHVARAAAIRDAILWAVNIGLLYFLATLTGVAIAGWCG